MEYARLKYGQIIAYDENAQEIDKPIILNFPDEIAKKSNKIKALCDSFVLDEDEVELSEDEKSFRWIMDGPDGCWRRVEYWVLNVAPVYGAIWTKKGLIYVAKFDGKEWELI